MSANNQHKNLRSSICGLEACSSTYERVDYDDVYESNDTKNTENQTVPKDDTTQPKYKGKGKKHHQNTIKIRKPGTINNNGELENGNVIVGSNYGPDMPPTHLQNRLDVEGVVKESETPESTYLEALRKEAFKEHGNEIDIGVLAKKLESLFEDKQNDDKKGYGSADTLPAMAKNIEKKIDILVKILKVIYTMDDLQQRYNALVNHHGLADELEILNC